MVALQHFGGFRIGEKSTVMACQKLLSDLKNGFVSAPEKVTDLSMLAVPPVLHNFPFVGINSSADIHAIGRFVRIHSLSLGPFKMQKKCIFKYLSDSERPSPSIQYQSGEPEPFIGIRKMLLKYLNLILKKAEGRAL